MGKHRVREREIGVKEYVRSNVIPSYPCTRYNNITKEHRIVLYIVYVGIE